MATQPITAIVVVAVGALFMAACGSSDDSSSSPPGAPSTTAGAPTTKDSSVDPLLCTRLREQAKWSQDLGPDPEFAFGVRDHLKTPDLDGGAVLRLPPDVQDDVNGLYDAINELLPKLDVADVSGSDPSSDLAAFQTENDEAGRILEFLSDACP